MLSQETYDKIDAFLEEWPDAAFGPGHITLDDCNVCDGHIRFCLEALGDYDPKDYSTEHTAEELEATRAFLMDLLAVPEEIR
jgi:hypothetical protein